MQSRRLLVASSILAASVLGAAVFACGSAGTPANAAGDASPSGAGEDGGPTPDGPQNAQEAGAIGGEILPDHHSPATGCATSEVACGPGPSTTPLLCTDPKTDAFNCGACAKSCAIGESCVAGACSNGSCANGVVCGGTCVHDRYSDPNHCGSCANRCGERELCVAYDCRAGGGGTGMSCDAPLVVPPASASPNYGFQLAGALVGMHTFGCGPLSPLPTRWFRFTASKSQTDLSAIAQGTADLILEVFAAPCGADGGDAPLACNDNTSLSDLVPRLRIPTTAGATYLVAVGVVSGSPISAKLDL
jgi:hypothetical protein